MSLTQGSVLSFLLEHGGKVKNSELLSSFRSFINCSDPAEKQHNRDVFKTLVNSVAVVKQVDEVKFVVVKKRYQDFVKEVGPRETQVDGRLASRHASFSYTPPRRAESARRVYPHNENKNARRDSATVACCGDAERARAESVQKRRPVSTADTTAVRVLNVSGYSGLEQASRAGKPGAVFAVVAVRPPPRDPEPATRDAAHPRVHKHESLGKSIPNVSPPPALTSNSSTCQRDLLREAQSWGTTQAGDVEAPASPLMRPQNKTTRQADDAKYCETVPLEPLAHEWLVKCAAGLWGQIYTLLLRDTRLAQRKDFMSGFTALHWAAKDGNSDMIHKLVDISSKRGTSVNVNSKAHGGYTPLHIAAIHGHTEVMVSLVQHYGANVNDRDNDGKKALYYLGKGASAEIRALLGGLLQSGEKTEDGEHKEPTKGFNTISKLFHPHAGKKQRTTKFANEW